MTAPDSTPDSRTTVTAGQAARSLEAIARHAVTEGRDCRGSLPCGHCERRITQLLAAIDDHVQAAIAVAAPAPAGEGVLLSDYLRKRGHPVVAAMIELDEQDDGVVGEDYQQRLDRLFAPGSLRSELEATVRIWREESEPYAGENPEEVARRGGFAYCADELAQVLAKHPQPLAAPGLAAELEALAAFWAREYVTDDGWPEVCAKQLLDVLNGKRDEQLQAAPDPLDGAMVECGASHCPPSMHTDCEWPKCATVVTPQPQAAPDLTARTETP